MAKRQLPSPEDVRQLLTYEPETGKLFWKPRGSEWFEGAKMPAEVLAKRWNPRYAGKEALTASSHGYMAGTVLGRCEFAHRVVWAIANGKWPDDQIDHVDGDRSNNRLCNLREATRSQNQMNRPTQSNNTSGVKGVSFHKPSNRWRAHVKVNGKQMCMGVFRDKESAKNAYIEGIKRLHGDFARMP